MNEGMNDDIIQHWNRESCQVGQSVGKLLQEHRCVTLMKDMKGKKKRRQINRKQKISLRIWRLEEQ